LVLAGFELPRGKGRVKIGRREGEGGRER